MPPILSKDSAKNRLSEGKESLFTFLSVRFLFKSKTIQNKNRQICIFIVEMQPVFAEEYAKTARIIHINIYFVGNLKENDYFCALNPMQNELYIRKERIMKCYQ